MKFNFDIPIDRRHTNSYKWDESGRDDVIPMWVADMDFQTAPAIVDALKRRVEHGVFGYTLVPESYYNAVIGWFARRHKWSINREWIQYTSGVVPALSAVVKALTEPGDQVIVQTPVYNCFFSSIRNNGCQVVENPLLRVPAAAREGSATEEQFFTYRMDYDDLERKVAHPRAKLLLLCNPHNPGGRVWHREELQQLNDICMRHGVKVVADEIHCELTLGGNKYVPFASVSKKCLDNSITCNSPSKSFNTAGLQIANIICNDEQTRQRIDRAININEVCDVNPFGVVGLEAAYNEGEEWLEELCQYLDENYRELCNFFAHRLPHLPLARLEGTYLVWTDIRATGMGAEQLAERLMSEARVQVNPGTMYGREAGEGYIRINIACPRATMTEGLKRMEKLLGNGNVARR